MAAVDSMLCVGLDSAARAPARRASPRSTSHSSPSTAGSSSRRCRTSRPTSPTWPSTRRAARAAGTSWPRPWRFLRSVEPGVFTIADAKRADIGSTNAGYVTGILDELGFDAVTLHPYLGREALAPFLEREDKACIVLCRTSNPGAGELQDLAGRRVAAVGDRGHARSATSGTRTATACSWSARPTPPSWRAPASCVRT